MSTAAPRAVRRMVTYKETMRRFSESFRLLDFSWEPVAETNDTGVYAWQLRVRMDGPFGGTPPTGREATASGVAILRFEGDKIAEHRSVWDTLGFFQRLGLAQWRGAEAEAPGAFA